MLSYFTQTPQIRGNDLSLKFSNSVDPNSQTLYTCILVFKVLNIFFIIMVYEKNAFLGRFPTRNRLLDENFGDPKILEIPRFRK